VFLKFLKKKEEKSELFEVLDFIKDYFILIPIIGL
jgi:hypothetical protein